MGASFLNVDQQQELAVRLQALAEKESLPKRLLFPNAAYTNVLSLLPLSFFTWRAGFRGYGLYKYNRGRLLTVTLALVYPCYGPLGTEMFATTGLLEPYRKENPWYHGARFALVNNIGIFITLTGNVCLTFLMATRSGLLPIPEGMHKPGVRQVAAQMLLGRIKPYRQSIALSALFSTAVMFAVGFAGYHQSCSILGAMNRKSLIYKED